MAEHTLFMRRGRYLMPTDDLSNEAFGKIKDGATIEVSIKRARNPQQSRLYWALIGKLYEHQTRFVTSKQLSEWLKIQVGWFDELPGRRREDPPLQIPRHLDFANCSQEDFEKYFDKVVDFVVVELCPHIKNAELRKELEEMVNGKRETATR